MRVVLSLLLLLLGIGAAVWQLGRVDPAPPATGAGEHSIGSESAEGGSIEVGARDEVPGDADAERAGVEDAAVVTGRVIQAAKPLRELEVIVCVDRRREPVEVGRVTTTSDGRFAFALPARPFWITSLDPRVPVSWSTSTRRHRKGALDLGDVDVPVPGAIDGRVVDEANAPVAGVRVQVQLSPHEHVRLAGEGLPEAVSDQQGWFRLERMPPEKLELEGHSEDHAVLRYHYVEVPQGGVVETGLRLRSGHRLRGLVVDWQGQPRAEARVRTEYGRETYTDALGRFVFEHFTPGADVTVTAAGHIELDVDNVWGFDEVLQARLDRAVTLRGTVRGTGGKNGIVTLQTVLDASDDCAEHAPYSLVDEPLDVLRDGRFELSGLSCSDWHVTVRVPGVGAVGPVLVKLRENQRVDWRLVPDHQVEVVVRDGSGQPVDGQLIVDDRRARYSSGYDPDERLATILRSKGRREPVRCVGGEARFGHPVADAVAFAVVANGHQSQAFSFDAGAVPDRVDVTMIATGSLRGTVKGGDRGAYDASLSYWPVGQAPEGKARRSTRIANDGSFAVGKILPGAYHAAVNRYGTTRPREDVLGVPLIDNGIDLGEVVDFRIVAGEQTSVTLREPLLGVLRGCVKLRGQPQPGVVVVASRPKEDRNPIYRLGSRDWDDWLRLRWVAGRDSDAEGRFRFYYRDAGLVELRLRHEDAHATSAPLRLSLPPPGDEVVHDLELPTGGIRGRFPQEVFAAKERRSFSVTLYPLRRATSDPYYDSGDWMTSIATDVAGFEGPTDGRFEFRFLPDGVYVVRVAASRLLSQRSRWQQVVEVRGSVVDLGAIAPTPLLDTTVGVGWQDDASAAKGLVIGGLWLTQRHAGENVWCGTVPVERGKAEVTQVAPGSYQAVPFHVWRRSFGISGISGMPVGEPVPVQFFADGTSEPATLRFVPLPPSGEESGDRGGR